MAAKVEAEDGESAVAGFITKVWSIVNMKEYDHLISWTESGKTFIVHDYSRFSREILPQYFKHSNFASFVRQLNLYGFRKVAKPDQGALLKVMSSSDSVEFWHTHFRRDHPEILSLVQRRPVANRTGNEEKKPQFSKVMSDLHHMKSKQENIATKLAEVKDENLQLKREVIALKQKHIHQQKILNKIIHFLISMLYKGRLPNRKGNRLMLTGEEDSSSLLPAAKRPHKISPVYYTKPPVVDAPPTPPPSSTSIYTVQSPSSVTAEVAPFPLPTLSSTSSTNPTIVDVPESSLPSASVPLEDLTDSPLMSSSDDDIFANLDLTAVSSAQLQTALQPQATTTSIMTTTGPEQMDWLSNISSHLNHQQHSINALHGSIPEQFSIDPSLFTDLLQSETLNPFPDYDTTDTARLLESLTGPQSQVPHETALSASQQQQAVVPFNQGPMLSYPSVSIASSVLEELLEDTPSQDTNNGLVPEITSHTKK